MSVMGCSMSTGTEARSPCEPPILKVERIGHHVEAENEIIETTKVKLDDKELQLERKIQMLLQKDVQGENTDDAKIQTEALSSSSAPLKSDLLGEYSLSEVNRTHQVPYQDLAGKVYHPDKPLTGSSDKDSSKKGPKQANSFTFFSFLSFNKDRGRDSNKDINMGSMSWQKNNDSTSASMKDLIDAYER